MEPRLLLSADGLSALAGSSEPHRVSDDFQAISVAHDAGWVQQSTAQTGQNAGAGSVDLFADVADEALFTAPATIAVAVQILPETSVVSGPETGANTATENAVETASVDTVLATDSVPFSTVDTPATTLNATSLTGQSDALSDQLTTTLTAANGPPASSENLLESGNSASVSSFSTYEATQSLVRARAASAFSSDIGSNTGPHTAADAPQTFTLGALKITSVSTSVSALEDLFNGNGLTLTVSGTIEIDGFLALSGSFSITTPVTRKATITDGTTTTPNIDVQAWTITATDVYAFVGVSGPSKVDSNSDGLYNGSDAANPDAVGLEIVGLSVTLVIMKTTGINGTLPAGQSFFALKATAASAGLVGMSSFLEVSASGIAVDVNTGSLAPGGKIPVVDFAASAALANGLQVPGINYSGRKLSAAASNVLLRVSDFVFVSGGLSINKGPTQKVDIKTGLSSTEATAVIGGLTVASSKPTNGSMARSSDGSTIWNVAVDALDFGLNGVDVFVGYTDDLATPAADADLTRLELEAANAIGVFMDEISLGLTVMRALPVISAPTLSTARFLALKVDASSVALLGVPGLALEGNGLQVRLNQGSVAGWPTALSGAVPVIDFTSSFSGGYQVPTSPTTLVTIAWSQPLIGFSADKVLLRISDFVYVAGGFSFNKKAGTLVDVRTGLTSPGVLSAIPTSGTGLRRDVSGSMLFDVPVQTLEFGLNDVDVFVGYSDQISSLTIDGDLTKAELGTDAIGVFLDDVDMGMVAMRSTATQLLAMQPRFFALRVDAGHFEILGIPEVTLSASTIQVRLNQGSATWAVSPTAVKPAIDFVQSFGAGGYSVQTSTSTSLALTYTNPVIGVSADQVIFKVSDFIYITGAFSLNKGPGHKVDINTGLTSGVPIASITNVSATAPANGSLARTSNGSKIWNVPVDTLEFGLSNVDVFVGYTDSLDSSPDGTAPAPVADYRLTKSELELANAIGVFLGNVSLGMVVMRPTIAAPALVGSRFFALKLDASNVALLGVPEFELTANNLQVRLNQGSAPFAVDPTAPRPVVDFVESFGNDGLAVQTSTTNSAPVNLKWTQPLIGVSADNVLLRISEFVYISGGFSFNKGPVRKVDIKTGVNSAVPFATITNIQANDPQNGTLARKADGSMLWNVPVETLDFGLSNVDVFVGYSNSLSTVVADGNMTAQEMRDTPGLNAIGLVLDDVDLAMVMMRPVTSTVPALKAARFNALKANAGTVELLGIPSVTARVETLELRLNQGSAPWYVPATGVMPVVDFVSSFPDNTWDPTATDTDLLPDGYRVQTSTTGPPTALLWDQPLIGVSADRVLFRISDFVYLTGGFSFNKGPIRSVDVRTGLTSVTGAFLSTLPVSATKPTDGSLKRTSDNSMIWNLPVETIDFGLSDMDVFVGYADDLDDALDANGRLKKDLLEDAGGIGVFLEDVNLGLAVMRARPGPLPAAATLNAAQLKFVALQANAENLGLIGVPEIELQANGAEVRVNHGSAGGAWPPVGASGSPPVIDFLSSFPDDSWGVDSGNAKDGYRVPTNTSGAFIPLLFDQPLIAGGAEEVKIKISQFVHITGSIYFEQGPVITAPLVAGLAGDISGLGIPAQFGGTGNKQIKTMTLGASNVHAFVGLKGPYWQDSTSGVNANGVIDRDSSGNIIAAEINTSAVGLVIDDLDFGLLLGTPTNPLDPIRYAALKASAQQIALVGINGITATANGIEVELNLSSPGVSGLPVLPVINFSALPGGKFGVKTGEKDANNNYVTIDLDMSTALIRAGGFVHLNILNSVYLSGSIGFELGPTKTVQLAGGGTKNVTTMSIGVANVNAFVGANGPYWTDTNKDNTVQQSELSSSAIGFSITDLDAGLLVMASTAPGDLGAYVALKASVTQFGLVNMPAGITATGAFDVELNVGFGTSGLSASISPVDLVASFSEAPALFALMDTDHNGVINQAEQTAALAAGYTGQNITSAAQLASILNATSGPPDEYLTISEVRAKLKDSFETSHQAAVNALDADANGRLNTGFEVFTGDPANPIILDAEKFLISIQLGGRLGLAGVFRMNGVFLFELDSSGLKAFVAAGLEVGPDIGAASNSKIFTMNALGALVINNAGLAADLEVSASVGGALQSVLSLNATARVVFNTTGVDQIITIPQRYAGFVTGAQSIVGVLPGSSSFDPAQSASLAGKLTGRFTTNGDGSLRFTIDRRAPRLGGGFDAAGSYFMVALHGDLTIARTFKISADFQLKVSAQGLQLGYNGTVDLGGFVTVNIAGGAVIENGVFAAYARLAIDVTVAGVRIHGGADFEINSGTASKTVFDAQGTGHAIAGTTYMVTVDATINLFNVLTATGTVKIGVTSGNFLIDVDATLSFFGILNVGISGYINTNGTFSFTGSLVLDLTYAGFGIRGGLSVTLNNSGFSGSGSVSLVVAGQNINVASGTVSVNWNTGAWLIRAEGPLSVWLEVSSNGQGGYQIDGGLGFFDDVLEVLGDVADAIADGAVAAANAVANAVIALGGAIVQFGEDVVEFFEDVGEAIADAAEAVWDAISGFFEDERTIITEHTVNPRDYYRYTTSLVNGTLTINNGTSHGHASQLNVWVVDGNLIVDAPDYTKTVVVSTSQDQERDYEWDGWPPYGEWSDWYNVGPQRTQTANITITNASNFAIGSVNKIVIIGTDNSETIVLDRATISINADIDAKGGNDVIATGKGNDRVWGRNGNDIIFTYEGNDELYGENDNDKLFGGTGNDYYEGGSGDDMLDENKDRATPGTLIGETNTMIGGSGADTILGSPGRDTITGGSENDILLGLSHDDIYVFQNGYGTDRFVDYAGKETLDFSGTTNGLTISITADGLSATSTNGNLVVDDLVWIDLLKLGQGSDTLTFTDLPDRLFTITDAGGTDVVTVNDSADSADNTGILTSSRLTGLGMGNANQSVVEASLGIVYSDIEDLRISLGGGNDTFTINSTHGGAGKTTTVNTGAGSDTIHLNNASAALTVNGQGHADTVNVNGTSAGSTVTLNAGDANDTINVNGTSGALTANGGNDLDTFNVAGTAAGSTTTLNGDAGDDIINVKAIAGVTTVNGGNDSDTINVGSNAAGTVGNAGTNSGGTVDSIAASLTINGDASGSDVLNVDDTGDSNANTGTLTLNTITQLDMAGSITYNTIEALNVSLGNAGNTVNIRSTFNGTLTTLKTGGGVDTINFGSTGPITLNAIAGKVVLDGQGSSDTVNLDDTGDDTTNTGELTSTRVTGLGMGDSSKGLEYSFIETVNVKLGTGSDTFNVRSTHANTLTTIATGNSSATNTINVGSLAPINVDAIAGKLVVTGQGSADTLNVDDSANTTTNTGLLTGNRLTGLGMAGNDASKGIEYTTIETLNITLGSGGDDFTIQQTHVGVTVLNTSAGTDRIAINATSGNTTVNTGSENDTVNVGTAATQTTNANGTLNAIQGALTINGGDGSSDTVNLDDTADGSANTGSLTSTQLTGLGMIAAGVTYSGLETLNLNLGSAGDTFTVVSTHAALTHIEARAGPDQITIRSIAGRTEIAGQDDADTINVGNTTLGAFSTVNGIQAELVLTGGGAADTLNVSELDEAAAQSALGTLTATDITGLGMAANGGVNYLEFETLNVTLGQGGDTFVVTSTHTNLTNLFTGSGNDQVNIQSLSGTTNVRGQGNDDTIRVNVKADGSENAINGAAINGVGALLDLDGQSGADTHIIYLAGSAFSATHPISLINVNDSGGETTGADFLEIYGPDNANITDNFLVRRNFIALVPPAGGTAERINYNNTLNAGIAIYARAGDDYIAFDDNSAAMTVDGGDGNDIFQLGQMFQSERVAPNVAGGDGVTTVHTTQGYLTPGISFATTIYGGNGNDQFVIFSNQGPLALFGEDGNDAFTVRAFALFGSQAVDPNRAGTNINAGLGADFVEYNINAPVAIDGGDGLDKIVVVGTEFSDRLVVTNEGIYGAGQFVTYVGIELIELDGAEGNDHFSILSTPQGVAVRLFGGLGSDTFDVAGQGGAVVSRDLQGHSGIIENLSVSDDVAYSGIAVEGIAVDVADNDAAGAVITPSGGTTVVAEIDYGIGLRIDSYTIVLTAPPTGNVFITASAPVSSARDQAAGARTVQLSKNADGSNASRAVELTFTAANWNQPQTVYVVAQDDVAAEDLRLAVIQHSVSLGSASGYAGLALPNVPVSIIDNDTKSVVLLPVDSASLNATRIGAINRLLEGNTALSSQSFAVIATQGGTTVSINAGTQLEVVGTASFAFGASPVAQLLTLRPLNDGAVEGAHRGTFTATAAGYTATELELAIADTNSAGVLVHQNNGSTRTIEGGNGSLAIDTYSVSLTQAPAAGQTVSIRILAVPTPTTNAQLVALTQGAAANQVALNSIVAQVSVTSTAPGATTQTIDGKTYLVLTFNAANWSTPQVVNVAAINDTTVDGGDIQVFARSLQTLDNIRGPLFIEGGIDPTADRTLANPVLYLGETNPSQHVAPPNPNFDAIEFDQIDSLWVHNSDAVAALSGTLTHSRLTGLGMGGDLVIEGETFGGGITYSNLEMFTLYLGKGVDTFEVQSTHLGETVIDAGAGNDTVNVRTVLGHTTILGNAGDDTINLGAPNASALTIDGLRALVTIDGGQGSDTTNLDDRGDTSNNVGTIDNTTIVGLDLIEARVRTLTIQEAQAGTFTITVDGSTTSVLPLASTAADVQAALVALGLPGVGEIVVNRAGNTFTFGFLGDETLADSALAVSATSSLLTTVGDSILNRVQTISLAAGSGAFTVSIGNLAAFSISVGDSADQVRAAIIAALNPTHVAGGVGIKDVLVSRFGSTYEIVFQGMLSGTRAAALVLNVAPRSTANGGSFSLNAIGGTFRLNVTGASAQTSPLAWNASAAEVQAVLRSLLGSNAVNVSGSASGFTVTGASIASVSDENLVAPIAVAQRTHGVNYFGIDTLNVNLSQGSDVLNIRGTTAITNVFGNNGDDRVYVSSLANENLTSVATTDFLRGNLDRILGTLNLDLGEGRHLLMISDEAAIAGDGTTANPVRITDQPVSGLGLPATEITITGLTPAPAITYRAAPAGNLADGVTIWTGWGADTITVDGTHHRGDGAIGSLRTITTLNTGLGNDSITVDLNQADGSFVLNTQGPENAYLNLADRDTVNASTSTRPLVIFGGQDDDTITGGKAADVLFADRGLVTYYVGANIVTVLGNGGPGDRTDGVERALGLVETVAPAVGGNDNVFGLEGRDYVFGGFGDDTLDASAGDVADDILVGDNGRALFTAGIITEVDTTATNLGGNDTLIAGKGANIAFGGVGNDTIFAGGDALRDILVGDNGSAKFDAANGRLLEIFTTAPGDAGMDVLTTGDGDSVVLGGSYSDLITTGAGHDIVVGDNGRAVFDGTTYNLISIETTVPEQVTGALRDVDGTSFDDVIAASTGNNIIFGGSHADHITTINGNDIVVGDNGAATFDPNGILRVIASNAVLHGGSDRILSGIGADVVFGGSNGDYIDSGSVAAGDISRDVVFGDNGRAEFSVTGALALALSTDSAIGGNDTILIGGGHNVALGGVGSDLITADAGDDVIVGDNGSATFALTAPFALLDIRTTFPADAAADVIEAGDGNNVILGGTGADEITTGTGADVILGDNGRATFDPTAILRTIETTDATLGGDDDILAGIGADIVFGGSGADEIDSGSVAAGDVSRDVVFGDNGRAEFGVTGALALAFSTDSAIGGNDTILIGGGDNVAIGGVGEDEITADAGADVILGDNGSATFAADAPFALIDIRTTFPSDAADDVILAGDGDNVVFGGTGADEITTGNGSDVIVGDNGSATFDPTAILRTIQTSDPALGGSDTIFAGTGADIVFGGSAGDQIDSGSVAAGDVSRDVVVGDNGQATFDAAGFLVTIATTVPATGGDDTIFIGGGDNVAFGGVGNDTITAGNGHDVIVGDNGSAIFHATSHALIDIRTSDPAHAGLDTIIAANGKNVVLGGTAKDTITTGIDADVVVGDNGIALFYTDGVLQSIETSDPDFGGDDLINTSLDTDVILAGSGKDTIDSGSVAEGDVSRDIVVGDNGRGLFDTAGRLVFITTTVPQTGGDDTILIGAGDNVAFGGVGNDTITAGVGHDIIVGDNGSATFDPATLLVANVQTSDATHGGVDTILAGDGNNIVLGGSANDTITTGAGDDIVLGDNGYFDTVVADANPADIDVIASTDTAIGGVDTITTNGGADIVIGGQAGDSIDAGQGDNIVFGDSAEIIAAIANATNFSSQPLTIGRMITTAPGIGGVDTITTGTGRDIIFGGTAGDTIVANFGETAGTPDGDNIVLGDDGVIDYVRAEREATALGGDTSAADIDYIASIDFADGDVDHITTGVGSDIVIGGQAGDTLLVSAGNNLVIGDSGIITAATEDTNRLTSQPLVIGRMETTAFGIGGGDTIVSTSGNDFILAGHDNDQVTAGNGDNVVLGDDGLIDFTRAERDGTASGADLVASDIDWVFSTSTTFAGGADTITTGTGNDLIIGGRFGDVIDAASGNNTIVGDSASVVAANQNTNRFGTQPITIGYITTTEFGDGGVDQITTLGGIDVILGGHEGDTINAGEGDNVIIGDDAAIDYTRLERGSATPGADANAADIDFITSISTTAAGGADSITVGNGNDLVIGGRFGDTIVANGGNNLVIGDSGAVTAANEDANRFGAQTITVGLIETITFGDGGADQITTLAGIDVILGGHDGDTINAGNGDNVVLGDDASIDYVRLERSSATPGADTNAADIDFITSLSTTAAGGADNISTGIGNDLVIGGRFGDTIVAANGKNVVIGDSGVVTAANEDANRFGAQAITIGRIESITFGDGGADAITTLGDNDVLLGGHDGDTIAAGDGDNVVLGDDAVVDYVRLERSAATQGADTNAGDIDLITSLSTEAAGGADTITTGSGNDIIIGGRYADTITDLSGGDVIVGDSATIVAADVDTTRFGSQAITLAYVATITPADGGADIINAGSGNDFIAGGADGDTIKGEAGNDTIYGDNVAFTFLNNIVVRAETIDNVIGGADTIRGEDDQDIIVGGAGADKIDGGNADDLIAGDNAVIDRIGRVGDLTNLLFERLSGGLIYDIYGNVLVDDVARAQPGNSPVWADFTLTLVDHSFAEQTAATNRFGADYIAGGAANDRIFGGLGNDTIQGDGSIDLVVSAQRLSDGTLQVAGSVEATSDGDDYIEGNGGNDTIFGGLGQDDIIGGNSNLFGLTDRTLRPDGSDFLFGGAGLDIAREDAGDSSAHGRARDADTIVGDNAAIFRLVGANGAYLTFAYDNYGPSKLIVRAVEHLDYTQGGLDLSPNAANDIGAADEIHGESGNDTIYGQLGNDVLFGDAQDDDIIGGTGADWISAGNGEDGVLGDDGRIYTSRNGTAETLYGIAAIPAGGLDLKISTPSKHQEATINVSGELKKTAVLEPFHLTNNAYTVGVTASNDIIFGGLGDDALHGGTGDDAISGAEALPGYYAKPFNPGNILGWGVARAGEFAAYNENDPRSRIFVNPTTYAFSTAAGSIEFILNFVSNEQDGDDILFGDTGNDWLVGGSGNDNMWGGYGDDLMNADGDHDTANGKNTVPDNGQRDADLAYGGAGRDILIGNQKNDRLIDWNGEFNSYLVPFSQFGEATVSRQISPQLIQFLYQLSASDGADPTRVTKTNGDASRNGEPNGEIGLVKQGDTHWGDQQGAPADPQPGNGGSGGGGGGNGRG